MSSDSTMVLAIEKGKDVTDLCFAVADDGKIVGSTATTGIEHFNRSSKFTGDPIQVSEFRPVRNKYSEPVNQEKWKEWGISKQDRKSLSLGKIPDPAI